MKENAEHAAKTVKTNEETSEAAKPKKKPLPQPLKEETGVLGQRAKAMPPAPKARPKGWGG